MKSKRLNCRGQFIPMAAMVMLSVVVFMVGIVNVFMVSRAKLRAQNLADAAAMYVAGHMVQSLNNVADKNEWLNLVYGDANDPQFSTAGHNPCIPPPGSNVPPGLGCFATGHPSFAFGDVQAAIAYANLVHTVNQTQLQFIDVYNGLLSAQPNGRTTPNANALQVNLYNAIPDLKDPDVYAIVFNSTNGKLQADNAANALDHAPRNSNAAPRYGVDLAPMAPVLYDILDVTVKYHSPAFRFGDTSKTLTQLMGGAPTGYLEIKPSTLREWNGMGNGGDQIAAGSIVRVTAHLIGLGPQTVQARSMAYVVLRSGGVGYARSGPGIGSARPTYFLKLGKPV